MKGGLVAASDNRGESRVRGLRWRFRSFLLIVLAIAGLAGMAQAAILPETSTTAASRVNVPNAGTTVTFAHSTVTGGANSNSMLIVSVSLNVRNRTATQIAGITYNGTALTIAGAGVTRNNRVRAEMWYLGTPAVGNNNVVVTFNNTGTNGLVGYVIEAVTYTGVVSATAPASYVTQSNNVINPTVTVTGGTNEDLAIDVLATTGPNALVSEPGQTNVWDDYSNTTPGDAAGTPDVLGVGSYEARNGANVSLVENLTTALDEVLLGARLTHATTDLATTKTAGGTIQVGSNVTYTMVVSDANASAQPANNVTVTDVLPAGLSYVSSTATQGSCTNAGNTVTCNLGRILQNANATVTITATITAVGTITNTVNATQEETDATPATASVNIVVPAASDIAITKAITTAFTVGANFTYRITVTNNGPSAATNVTVTDNQPAGVTFGATTPSQGSCAGTTPKICTLGGLAVGATATIDIVSVASQAEVINTASVTATQTDPVTTNNSWTVTSATVNTADIGITKTATASTTVGGNITYTLTVTNNGGTAPNTANLVTVTDPLPTGTTWISTTTNRGSCSGTTTVVCNLGNMVNAATATITIVVRNTSAGTKGNTATLGYDTSTTYDSNEGNNSATATTTVTGTGSAAPSCAVPVIGPGGVLNTVVNAYYPGTASVAAGSTTITLGAARGAPAAQNTIAVNDLLLVIQMQDATVNSTNSNNYGGGIGTGAGAMSNNAGKYEFVRANSAVGLGGGTVTLATALINSYTDANASPARGQARFQVVRGLEFTSATLAGATAAPWLTDGTGHGTGGVLALDISGTLTFNTGVAASVNGQGFRGAGGRALGGDASGTTANTDWRTSSTLNVNGGKGEGNAGTPEYVYDPAGAHACGSATNTFIVNTGQPNDGYPQGSMAQGAPGTAGGGSTDGNPPGNDENSGGGGGSNGGAGGTGGLTWSTYINNGGKGAAVIPAISQLILGGGGGAGTRNNTICGDGVTAAGQNLKEGQASSGAAGGGIMFLRAQDYSIAAGANVSANGSAAFDDTDRDGGGGGGAGGSLVLEVVNGGMAGLTAQANGGKGGSAWRTQAPGTNNAAPDTGNNRHGPGGGGGGGVIAYSSPAAPPTMSVAGGASGISTTANDPFGAQAGATGQMLVFAPGQIPGVGTAATCAFDPAITLSHSPATQSSGAIVGFVTTVRNAGAFTTTTGVMSVTITIDPGLAFSGLATGTGWTCAAPAGQSVTCTHPAGLAAQASWPPITFNATVLVAGPATLSNNTAVVTNAGDANLTNNTATDVVGVRAPTLARLRSFRAMSVDGGVQLHWQTSFEAHNLGFRIYRETNGARQLVTPSIIAGSALFVGKPEMRSGRSYSWLDTAPGASPLYWLEDVDISGARHWTGPVLVDSGRPSAAGGGRHMAAATQGSAMSSPLLAALSQGAPPAAHTAAAGLGFERRARMARGEGRRVTTGSAAKLLVTGEGWYRLSKADLQTAGFDPGSNPARLALIAGGEPQAIAVHDGGDGQFDANDTIEFYGLGFDSPWDAFHVYWLAAVDGRHPRISTLAGGSAGAAPTSFPFTVERKDRTVFFSALTNNGDNDNFFGDVVMTDPVTQTMTLTHVAVGDPGSATLTIALQGVTTDVPHDVDVTVNGNAVGHIAFQQMEHRVQTFTVPLAWLQEGSNDVVLKAQGGDNDISLVDYIHLTYPHLYELDGDALRCTAPAHSQITFTGLADHALRVVDATRPEQARELAVQFADGPGGTTATVSVPDNNEAVLYAFEPARVLAPAGIVPNHPSDLRSPENTAEMVVLAHPQLLDRLKPLQDARNAGGVPTTLFDVTDVYDEFAFGQKTPYAIRSFLMHTQTKWKHHPRFVMLVGDASFDPKNSLGLGDFDLVPTKLIPTTYLKTDSDDWFVDFDGNSVPDMAIGRLPARTPDEVSTMVAKILSHDAAVAAGRAQPMRDWRHRVLLISDQPDVFDFNVATDILRGLLPPRFMTRQLQVSQAGPAMHQAIVDSINAGALVVNYVGHGSEAVWSQSGFYDGGDALNQTNGDKLPFLVGMTCLNGLFDDLYVESMAESFLKAPNGGAVAVWTSSALTEPEPQADMNQQLFRLLFQGPPMALGEAVARSKSATSDLEVRRTWVLFGDPSMQLR